MQLEYLNCDRIWKLLCTLLHLFPFPSEDKELMDYWITVKPVTPCYFMRSVVIGANLKQHAGGRSQFCL